MTRPIPPTPAQIRELRESRGETQAEFGRSVGLDGPDESIQVTVSRWETGVVTPSPWRTMQIRDLMEATNTEAR